MEIERTGSENIAHINNRNPGPKNDTQHQVALRKRRNAADLEFEDKSDKHDFYIFIHDDICHSDSDIEALEKGVQ
ncbi:MAG: hypothetical protein PF440_02525 [Thiomicrorhabdus sp.]|jgi:hypothetical protein|nr:hypothetical protein [Thiomicrorhabdus sp.]